MKLHQVELPYWKSGAYTGIAVLTLSIADVERRFGLKFRPDCDDLGPFQWAAVEIDGFGCILFALYAEDAHGGMTLFADIGERPSTAFAFVAEYLGLKKSDVVEGGREY